ncbi:uncharacterized protein [Euphorbia lathyris]|uniref:uncharacterized protein isoform X2 n=1 Tax=Euphorbia lathyris TaxID=212925 RepID=UPI0033141A21
MKQTKLQTDKEIMAAKQSVPPPPPPPPPLPSGVSVTNQEIAKFWRKKRIAEEDHLLAAIKAAARLRARNLTEEDYKNFEESLKDDNVKSTDTTTDECNKEVRVGIKDWITLTLSEPTSVTRYCNNNCFFLS